MPSFFRTFVIGILLRVHTFPKPRLKRAIDLPVRWCQDGAAYTVKSTNKKSLFRHQPFTSFKLRLSFENYFAVRHVSWEPVQMNVLLVSFIRQPSTKNKDVNNSFMQRVRIFEFCGWR